MTGVKHRTQRTFGCQFEIVRFIDQQRATVLIDRMSRLPPP